MSLVLFLASLVLFGLSYALNPWDNRISLTEDFHVGLWKSRVVIFNDAEYGPYRGSIISLIDADGKETPYFEQKIHWGETLGVYYRYFRWTESNTLWTLMVSLLWPVGVFGLLSTLWIGFLWRKRVASFPASHLRRVKLPSV